MFRFIFGKNLFGPLKTLDGFKTRTLAIYFTVTNEYNFQFLSIKTFSAVRRTDQQIYRRVRLKTKIPRHYRTFHLQRWPTRERCPANDFFFFLERQLIYRFDFDRVVINISRERTYALCQHVNCSYYKKSTGVDYIWFFFSRFFAFSTR